MARSIPTPGPRPDPSPADLPQLGSLVRHRRQELGLRIDDAAHACGVAVSVMSRLENGGAVGMDRFLKILDGLGLSMLVLRKDESIVAAHTLQSSASWANK